MTTTREKTRPSDNAHCFRGVGLPYWLAIARGFTVTGVRSGPLGASIALADDTDGYALQNGGMWAPQRTSMMAGGYYRFFGTIDHNRFGKDSSMAGGWWIDTDTYVTVTGWADEHGLSLAAAARHLLAIPREWHDCGYVGRAWLLKPLRAYVGKGKPATGSISPHSDLRRAGGIPLTMSPPHLEVKQWFVPGGRALLAQFFQLDRVVHVIKPGVTLK